MKTIGKILLALLPAMACLPAAAQRFSLGCNALDCLALGTVNADVSAAVGKHFSLHAGATFNPWTYRPGDGQKQLQARQLSVWGGSRWWPWHIYSGWWAGIDARYLLYNVGGIGKRETEEGEAYGARLWGGYSVMLSRRWNLDLGIGLWGGWKDYTLYACPLCGVVLEQKAKSFIYPDARIAVQWIF